MSQKRKILNLPLIGRIAVIADPGGGADHGGSLNFLTNVSARVIRKGEALEAKKVWGGATPFYKWVHRHDDPTVIDLGSGLVTNIGVLAMGNEFAWANPSGAVNTVLANSNFHATGTGTTAAATTDFKLQTASTQGGQTPVAGAQTLTPSGTSPAYKTVATINYTGTEAVTEWGLFTGGTLSSTSGSPFTATSSTSGTATGTPFTASSSTVAGQQLNIVVPGTTTVWGLVTSNSTSALTVPAWYTQAAGAAGSTPGSTEAYTLRPVLWDHKVFSAINVVNGDSIQFSYSLTISSGG